jgi:hypothetical protein
MINARDLGDRDRLAVCREFWDVLMKGEPRYYHVRFVFLWDINDHAFFQSVDTALVFLPLLM